MRDLFTGRMSWRRLRVILSHLPEDSAYRTAVNNASDPDASLPPPPPGIFGPWSKEALLLATALDLFRDWMWAQADPNKRGPRPAPLPRPGVVAKVRPISAEALAFLEYKRQHQGEDPPEGWEPVLA